MANKPIIDNSIYCLKRDKLIKLIYRQVRQKKDIPAETDKWLEMHKQADDTIDNGIIVLFAMLKENATWREVEEKRLSEKTQKSEAQPCTNAKLKT